MVFFGVRAFGPGCPQPWTPPQETFIKVSKTEGTRTVILVAQDLTRPGPKARRIWRERRRNLVFLGSPSFPGATSLEIVSGG